MFSTFVSATERPPILLELRPASNNYKGEEL
jgi:hypothetical protein